MVLSMVLLMIFLINYLVILRPLPLLRYAESDTMLIMMIMIIGQFLLDLNIALRNLNIYENYQRPFNPCID